MDSEVIKVSIQEGASKWPLILTAVTAVGALFAAGAAWRNTKIANKARVQQLINDLLDYRYSEKMFKAMRALRVWYDKHKANEGVLAEEFRKIRDTEEECTLDSHRKVFFTYFRKIKDLQEAGFIKNEERMKGLVNKSDLTMLLHINAPMGRAIESDLLEIAPVDPGRKKEQDIFDYFEKFYWKYHRGK